MAIRIIVGLIWLLAIVQGLAAEAVPAGIVALALVVLGVDVFVSIFSSRLRLREASEDGGSRSPSSSGVRWRASPATAGVGWSSLVDLRAAFLDESIDGFRR